MGALGLEAKPIHDKMGALIVGFDGSLRVFPLLANRNWAKPYV